MITISMGCDRRCVDRAAAVGISVSPLSSLSIAKRYKGQGGFLRLLQEFSGGGRTFALNDFGDSYAPSEWQRLSATLQSYRMNTIRVSLRVDVPPSLGTFMSLIPSSKPPTAITK
jgi:hypothetical protein